MGMGVTLDINRIPIVNFSVIRIETFKGDEEIHRYRIRVMDKDKMYHVKHKYSDGALVLAKLALEVVINDRRK